MHPPYAPTAHPRTRPRQRSSAVTDRLVFLALPLIVLGAILALLWSAGTHPGDVPQSVRAEATRNCSSAPPPQPVHSPGSPEFDRCVSDWIAILWD